MSPRKVVIGALLSTMVAIPLGCEDSGGDFGENLGGAGVVSGNDGHGLKGTYFNNKEFTDQVLERVDPVVDFDWGRGSPDSRVDADTFSARWTGFVEAKFSDRYTFYTVGDDGIRLYVDGQLVVSDWSNHGARERSGTIDLEAGKLHSIKLEYYEDGGGAMAKLLWSSPSQAKETISDEQLYAELPTDGAIITASGENSKHGEVKENAFDGDPKTKWLTFTDSAWIQYDFAGDASKVVTQYSITSANDASERDPRDWRLLGSNDGSRFTTVDARSGERFSARFQRRSFSVQNPGSFKMYRLDISSNYDPPSANSTQLAEIEFAEGEIPGDELCAEADENKTVTLSCPDGEKITNILFASYGIPTGSCEDGFSVGTCHALLSQTKVEETCLGKTTCTVAASNGVFGDPCVGKGKQLSISYTCGGSGVVDRCPNDPNKTEPGECGCGVPEGTCSGCASTLSGNETVDRGELLCSPNGQYRFGLDDGGDLVLLAGSEVLWSAGLCCDAGFLAMQGSDGNLVVYTDGKSPRWASRTAGNPGAILYVEDDGRAVIRIGSRELWSVGGVDDGDDDPPEGEITHVGTNEIWDADGQNIRIARPSGSKAGDLLVLILHRTDDDLPLYVDGWTRVAECYKGDNPDACAIEEDCQSWHNDDFCRDFGANGGGHDLAQSVFYKKVGSSEPNSYEFDLNVDSSGHPGWIILTALRGAATSNPVRDWANMGCDGSPDSIFPSVYGVNGDMVLLSQSYDDKIAQSKFGAPAGTTTFGYVANSDESGFLFGGAVTKTGETGTMKTQGDGSYACKDALVSLTIKPQ